MINGYSTFDNKEYIEKNANLKMYYFIKNNFSVLKNALLFLTPRTFDAVHNLRQQIMVYICFQMFSFKSHKCLRDILSRFFC